MCYSWDEISECFRELSLLVLLENRNENYNNYKLCVTDSPDLVRKFLNGTKIDRMPDLNVEVKHEVGLPVFEFKLVFLHSNIQWHF